MIIDSIYSGNEDIACHHCIPIGIIRLSVINSLSNLNGSHTISCFDLLSFFFLRSSRRAFLLPGLVATDFATDRDPWTRIVVEKKKRSLRKIRTFLGLVSRFEPLSLPTFRLHASWGGFRWPYLRTWYYSPFLIRVHIERIKCGSVLIRDGIWWILLKSILIYFICTNDWNEMKTSRYTCNKIQQQVSFSKNIVLDNR